MQKENAEILRFSQLNIETRDMQSLVADVVEMSKTTRDSLMLNCINPHSFVVAQKDEKFRTALKQSHWLLPDGIGVVLASKFMGLRIKKRLTGPDVFNSVMKELNIKGGSVVFFGSSVDNLAIIEKKVRKLYPSIEVKGLISPPFVSEFTRKQNEEAVAEINSLNPDILWVGMTAPKQEKWILQNRYNMKVGVAAGIGAAFDFFSGRVSRAPQIVQSLGLEWLYRLCKDPLRLAPRTFQSGPSFFRLVSKEILSLWFVRNRDFDQY